MSATCATFDSRRGTQFRAELLAALQRELAAAAGALLNPGQFFHSYLLAYRFWLAAALGGQAAHQLLSGWQGYTGLQRQFARTKARASLPASGGGHDHDRIIGKMGQAHINSDYLRLI